MKYNRFILLFLFSVVNISSSLFSFDHFHEQWGNVLRKYTSRGSVNYLDLHREPQELSEYLSTLSKVQENDFLHWSQDKQLAFLLNLYNAATIKLIIDNYPVQTIRDIGGFFSGPWSKNFILLFHKKISLDNIEHQIIRKKYSEPRIHFALVCAAKGCPPLRHEPYTHVQLDSQLNEQALMFLNNPLKNYIDKKTQTLYLSPIFKWYREDFEKNSLGLLDFLTIYWKNLKTTESIDNDFSTKSLHYDIRYLDYDWSLNEWIKP